MSTRMINEGMRAKSNEERYELYSKLYLGEIIDLEKPTFNSNSLILAPVGSGKSHLIENILIPNNCDGNILYLTSNTALKDSVCPNDDILREKLANKGKSIKFYTTTNKKRYGDKLYNVHVMTYHEFGNIIQSPAETFTKNIDIVFCDEVHSLPRYRSYGGSDTLVLAMNWLFKKHENKQIYYFTATRDSLEELESRVPGYLHYVTVYDYLEHPDIRKYIANSIIFIKHIEQVRDHLKSKLKAFNYYGYKGLAFTRLIAEQKRIEEIAIEEGFKPIVLWSINNDTKMNDEQLKVREYILNTGNIPEPYNLLIINGSMQEGWNLDDNMMRLAILDTLDQTEQIQALGRIRRDIDLLICKTNDRLSSYDSIDVPDKYLDTPLTSEDKTNLYIRLNVINDRGAVSKWPTVKGLLEKQGYTFEDRTIDVDNKKTRVTIITKPILK